MSSELSLSTPNCITLNYYYSACIKTTTPDVSVLHDPWFTDGIYDGSWYQFPKLVDPLSSIGDCDYIYISHIHPDHYDPVFLRKYFSTYGVKVILIADHSINHLARKLANDGFHFEVISSLTINKTTIALYPHVTGSSADIDSAFKLIYKSPDSTSHTLLNLNDVPYDKDFFEQILLPSDSIDILLCSYTGAGPYPQTYFELDDSKLPAAVSNQKLSFFNKYLKTVSFFESKVNIPFAGQYILGGALSHLNNYRGTADATEILSLDTKAIVLEEGKGFINTDTLEPMHIRTEPYPNSLYCNRISEVSANALAFELDFSRSIIPKLPLARLLKIAYKNSLTRFSYESDYYFALKISTNEYFVFNINSVSNYFSFVPEEALSDFSPISILTIEPRYLFGLLTGLYHWNNAEVGSHLTVRRSPDVYIKDVQDFLIFFTAV